MLIGTLPHARPQAAARFLRADSVLARVLKVPEPTYVWRLEGKAMSLVAHYFPDKLDETQQVESWLFPDWAMKLQFFLKQVEDAGWFDIDWDLLNYLAEWAQNDEAEGDDSSDPDWMPLGLCYMAEYLDGIPVKTFGFNPESPADDIGQYPPLALLEAILSAEKQYRFTGYSLDFDVFEQLPPDLAADQLEQAWKRIDDLGTGLEQPLCWLPEMARFACDRTGNAVLDQQTDITMDLWPTQWSWTDDLDLIREQWTEAQPTLTRVKQFLEWAEGEEQLDRILKIVTEWLNDTD